MGHLELNDLFLVVNNFLRHRLAVILLLANGARYQQLLEGLRERLKAHGITARGSGLPMAAELSKADVLHDAYARAGDKFLSGYEALPDLSKEAQKHVGVIREHFIPDADVWSAAFATEASNALHRRPLVATHEESLKALPMPDNKTFFDLVEGMISNGELIDDLLQKRSKILEKESPEATQIRKQALSLTTKMRRATRDELDMDTLAVPPTLPRNLERQIFAYADELVRMRRSGNDKDEPSDDLELESPPKEPTDPKPPA